jgi:hypothetical protein
MPDLAVALEPLDPVLFGDNRSGGLADQDPSPATLYGAIGARLAAALGARGQADWEKAAPVLGPFEPRLDRPSEGRAALLGYTLADPEGWRSRARTASPCPSCDRPRPRPWARYLRAWCP